MDVGCGSGYLCAAFYELVKDEKNPNRTAVVGIEYIDPLVDLAKSNLNKSYKQELESNKIKIISGDGRNGYPSEAPYDYIHVGAAAPTVPKPLIDQLKVGGKLFIPVGKYHQF